ncbi:MULTISPECIES: LysE family transporter [Salegentibacter]|jgi:threonine/homoserine/homoserine lactone efflux protein|uniref:Threonine/homoserine/homoserine lactone efflux protein n=1 Tax=Salegentibacter agarivorans TaxID=345907 RepID=A0A1I2MH21_9FLAO|nr:MULTISPECIES: LysE family transporter [Salegentibacter]APS38122.1 lysine transporter LysE [Salegentibacter sp. T436]MBO2543546.1 LysE family transporter [Salegentibacter sp. BDJ18]SFF90190.1 Threonine/homoserine/homoserine lactone efflux protein [Salegentibacter agarivorans]|tara:strand:+ start:589 stop:1287 length:699 start_codon:yes stop_codon:yes gene_type:complete
MFQDVLAALPLGLFLAFLLGPVFFVLLETAAIKGFRAAFAFDLGVILADIVFLFVAYLSTTKLLASIKDDPALFIFGGMILATYGVMSFVQTKKVLRQEDDTPEIRKLSKSDYMGLAVKGFLLNFINIGVLGFWLGLIIVFGPKLDMEQDRIMVFFGSVLGTYLVLDVFKILLAKKLNRKLTPNRIYLMKKGISIMLIVFGGMLIFQGLFPNQVNGIKDQIETITPNDTIKN